jgi:hypothetical protein
MQPATDQKLRSAAPDCARSGADMGETMTEVISIARHGATWAIKHRGSFLGGVGSVEEAERLGRDLVRWLSEQGRAAQLQVERDAAKPEPVRR